MRARALLATALLAAAPATGQSLIETYSQKTLLKNWALSVCLATVARHADEIDDANKTASAYMEFGHQSAEDYERLRQLATSYARRQYGGSVDSDFNTMKCIDLFHSKELDTLAGSLARRK
ncbi:T6SS amidase immunity protein Tai4 family protein [Bordetella genomosp. 13]|uniref:T6SS amidase immunity protein Tai4 family protein n=1 Tax=Bordetella genomosp. 13 TaxID=463040 RepID=UPI0011A6D191|nr:T6SS amidase immunity protein Tai4 family protein [Bordetella genomosp. 13]